ncbi:MAG: response regulator [Steroidobacteraceae bacterium]
MGKRALIVDDSKSARLSLARMLEKHGIEVDTAESAELALVYLGTHRPDAIFMDHMMSGMDGLQAVRAIKNNPRTATIPIMMYTSQEGELYVGQARALGAIGVLPKQVMPADVTKVLYQLNLAVDRRGAQTASLIGDDAHTSTHPLAHSADSALHGGGLREQLTDLRRTVLAGFDSQGDRLLADMRAVLREPHPLTVSALVPPPAPRAWLPWLLAAAMAGACVALAVTFWHQGSRLSSLQEQLAQLQAAAPAAPPQAAGAPAADAASAPASTPAPSIDAAAGNGGSDPAPRVAVRPIVQMVPYGVEPFSGSRLDGLRQLFDRLTAQGFQGNVDIRTYSGRFCLVGNVTDGYSPAPDDLPYAKCDMISGARDDSMAGVTRVPIVMADLMAAVRAGSHDLIRVQVGSGDGGGNIAAYPAVSDTLTAGDWNRAADANNRIEIRVR